MSLVNVADFKSSALTAESTRSHGVEAALVHHFIERVDLAHELRQLRAGEELADAGHNRANVNELAGSNGSGVVNRHAVLDDTLHTSETDAELRLHQLTDHLETAVGEVVDVVGGTVAVRQVDDLGNDSYEVFAAQNTEVGGVGNIKTKALIELVTADFREVVALEVKEHAFDEALGVLNSSEVTGANATVNFHEGFRDGGARVFLEGLVDILNIAGVDILEERLELFVGAITKRTQQGGDGQLTLAVDLDGNNAGGRRIELEPGSAARDNLGAKQFTYGSLLGGEKYAWATNQLRYHDALGAVNHKSSTIGHPWVITQEDFLLADFAGLFIYKFSSGLKRDLEAGVLDFGGLLIVLRLFEIKITQIQRKARSGEVLDRVDLSEQFVEAFRHKPLKRIELDFDEVRQW